MKNHSLLLATLIITAVFATAGFAQSIFAATTISTDISTGGTLSVTGTTATSTFSTGGLTVGTSQFVVQQTSGYVGIGTANPQNTLELYDDSNGGIIALTRDGGFARGDVVFGRHNSGTLQRTGMIESRSDSASPNNGLMTFWTSNSSGTNTERMRINGSGNVGIGTTSPASLLSVQGNGYFSGTGFFGGAITGTSTLAITGTGDSYILGNVGIGTTTPFANFQVTAAVNATTTMEIGRAGSNKGSCVKLYDAAGVAWYYTPAVGTGALTSASASSCASVTGF